MAVTRFDLKITSSNEKTSKGLDTDEKQDLFRKPDIKERKRKEAGNVARAQTEETQESPFLELSELSEAYSELIERSDNLLETVKERSKGLDYIFNPEEQPILAEAVGSIFKGVNDKITYNMYLAALKLDKDISVQIGESESGFVR